MSLQRIKAETTSSEVPKWAKYLKWKKEQELKHASKMDYYLAQIACEVHNVLRKRRRKIDKFLLKFDSGKSNLSKEERTARSKAFWKSAVGIQKGQSIKYTTRLPPNVKQKK